MKNLSLLFFLFLAGAGFLTLLFRKPYSVLTWWPRPVMWWCISDGLNVVNRYKRCKATRITCPAPANVQFEITGSDYIDGIKNKVNCVSGTCTMNFPSGNPMKK